MLFLLPFGQSQQFSLCGFDLRSKQRALGKDHIVVEGENRQVNERLDLGGRTIQNRRDFFRVIGVSGRKAAQGKFDLLPVFPRHAHADQKAHGRRHFIRQRAQAIHHALDILDILKHDAERALFNPLDGRLGAGEHDFLLGGEIIIDAAVLQLRRRAEILCGGDRQPLFNKAIKADGDDFPSSFGFLVFVQAMTSFSGLSVY